jgi:hypothetical protein
MAEHTVPSQDSLYVCQQSSSTFEQDQLFPPGTVAHDILQCFLICMVVSLQDQTGENQLIQGQNYGVSLAALSVQNL